MSASARTPRRIAGKCVTREVARERVRRWIDAGEIVVLASGAFDVLSVLDIAIVRRARAAGSRLVVGIQGDAAVTAHRGPAHPILSEIDRMALVAALSEVDLVVRFDEASDEVLGAALGREVIRAAPAARDEQCDWARVVRARVSGP